MNIDLKPEHQQAIDRALQAGLYRNSQEIIESALDLMFDEGENWMEEEAGAVHALITDRLTQAERGEFVDGKDAFAQMRARRNMNIKYNVPFQAA